MTSPTDSLFGGASEKLVRDCYGYLPHRVAGRGERYGLLAAKLDEEIAEVKAADIGSPAFIEELGDLVEVCYALGGREAVEAARIEKFESRGGFDRLLVMRLEDRTDEEWTCSCPPTVCNELPGCPAYTRIHGGDRA